MKSLELAEIKKTKEKLIIFKNELIRKNRIKKIFLAITMEILNTKALKILDIYLMNKIFTMTLMILNIFLIKMNTKILKEILIMLKKSRKMKLK